MIFHMRSLLFYSLFFFSNLIGWIRDVTQSFIICFNSLSVIMSLCAVPWIIEMIWLRIHARKDTNDRGVIA